MNENENENRNLVDKINYKRAVRMHGHAPHKLFKMEIKKYLKKKEEEEEEKSKDVFNTDSVKWKDLHKEE